MAESTLTVIFEGKDKGLKGTSEGLIGPLQKLGKIGLGGLAAGAVVAGAGLAALTGFMVSVTGEAEAARDVQRQLNAVLESTGFAAGLNTEEINEMARAMRDVTGIDDDLIMSGQSMLLTFKEIGEEIFPRATMAMLDYATAMGTDPTQAAIQLGKALNDPIQGIGALSRVGVQFTEEQKELIATMMEAGDVMGAQNIILSELESQFGGSAEALSTPAKHALLAWGDLREMLGKVGLEVRDRLAAAALPLLQSAMETVQPIAEAVSAAFGEFMDKLALGIDPIQAVSGLIFDVAEAFGLSRGEAANLALGFENLVAGAQVLWGQILALKDQVVEFLAPITEAVTGFVTWKDVLIGLGIAIAAVLIPVIASIVGAIAPVILVFAAVTAGVALLRTAWEENWGGIQEKVAAVIAFVVPLVQNAIAGIQAWWAENGDAILAKAAQIWESVRAAIETAINTAWAIIQGVVAALRTFWEQNGDEILAKAQAIWNGIRAAIETAINLAWAIIQGVVAAIQTGWQEHGDTILASAQSIWESIRAGIETAINAVKTVIETVAGAILTFWETYGDDLLTFAQSTWDAIELYIDAAFQQIAGLFETFAALFKGDWEGFGEGIKTLWTDAWDAITAIIETLWEGIEPFLESLWTNFTTWFSETDWAGLGVQVVQGIIDGLNNMAGALWGAVAGIIGGALGAGETAADSHSSSREFAKLGMNMGLGVAQGIAAAQPAVVMATGRMVSSAVNTTTNNYYWNVSPSYFDAGQELRTAQAFGVGGI